MRETTPPETSREFPIAGSGVFPTLAALILVLLTCSYLIVHYWPQPAASSVATGPAQPLQGPGGAKLASFHLPAGYSVIYEQPQGISLLSTTNGVSRTLETPGYIYNRAVTPIITPAHELIYSGDGIWTTGLTGGHATRLAALPSDQVITSLALSPDGGTIAWSSAPKAGAGTVAIYVEVLSTSAPAHIMRVYQHAASQCPCFRVFSFLSARTLLLTNDRGDHRLVQYGLWRFDLPGSSGSAIPRPLLPSDVQQGPLLFSPQTGTLLYSSYEGFVPMPDSGVPTDITSLNYANSLLVASMKQAGLAGGRVILPEQQALSGPAAYRWVATPQFSPDGESLAYIEFSSGDRLPFARHYALYGVSLAGASNNNPQSLATASAQYVELGPWLAAHTLTFYADNALYALDMQHGALATLAQTGGYARIISIVE